MNTEELVRLVSQAYRDTADPLWTLEDTGRWANDYQGPVGTAAETQYGETPAPPMDVLDISALVPGPMSDVTGPIADLRMYARDPEQITPTNVGFSLAGLLPFVPSVAGAVTVKGKKLNRDQEVQYHREAAQEFRNEFGAPELPTLIAPNYGQALRENRAFKRREMASGAGTAPPVVTAHHGRPPQPEYRPTTDDVLVPVVGDPTRTGETVREVGGVELPVPVDLQGGPLHAQQWGNWSSMRSAAGSKQANVRVAVERTGGKNPVLVYTTMDQASPNFSTMPVEVALQQMDVLSPSKETIRKFNARIKKDKRGKGFVGIDTKEGREQLMREGSGNLRKAVMETMALKEFQYQGMPDVELIRDAIIEPALRHVPPGQSGFTMMRGLPDLDVYPDDYHRTYNTHIPGRYLGTTSVVPYEDMFPDVAAKIKGMDRAYELGSLRQRHHYQPVTDELLERLYGGK